jgi:hypothetical protein
MHGVTHNKINHSSLHLDTYIHKYIYAYICAYIKKNEQKAMNLVELQMP